MQKAFKLEKVIDFRNRVLDKEKANLAALMEQDAELQKSMQTLADEIIAQNKLLEEERASGNFSFIDMYEKYIGSLEAQFLELSNKRAELAKAIDNQKTVLRKALSDVKVMEKLKEKHKEDYQQFLKKLDEAVIDEINITRNPNNVE